uniref:Immunoglobulin domain-containing protein n=1 Tax=Sinocyclocheilus rhinocerous TaxID=307959 RepID=A0A673MMK3_9TELE
MAVAGQQVGVFSIVSVSAMKGDSVTLHTNIIINQPDRVKWYFNDIFIAQISGDLSDICTDVQCHEGSNERFRDRLQLDNQTADLTITNTSDNGVYHLKVFSSRHTGKDFDVVVHDVPAAGMKRKAVTEGESVTLDTPEEKKPNDVMAWFFNDTLIAEITGDQSKIWTDDECDERFRDRLQLDHQTGSLTITNTRSTDSGVYHLKIKSSRNRYSTTSIKSFSVSVTSKKMVSLHLFISVP